MGVNIDEILASLEETEKTAEATLADNLSAPEEVATETPTDEPANEATSEETVEETVEEQIPCRAFDRPHRERGTRPT